MGCGGTKHTKFHTPGPLFPCRAPAGSGACSPEVGDGQAPELLTPPGQPGSRRVYHQHMTPQPVLQLGEGG
jgi:hypothetical protein